MAEHERYSGRSRAVVSLALVGAGAGLVTAAGPVAAGAIAVIGVLGWGLVRWGAIEARLFAPQSTSATRMAADKLTGIVEEWDVVEAVGDGDPGEECVGWVATYVARRLVAEEGS